MKLLLNFILFIFLLFAFLNCTNNYARKSEERECIRDNHKVVEEVSEFPNEVVGCKRTKEDKYDSDYRVDNNCNLVVLEEILNIELSKEVPADYCRESKEQEADCDKDVTKVAKE